MSCKTTGEALGSNEASGAECLAQVRPCRTTTCQTDTAIYDTFTATTVALEITYVTDGNHAFDERREWIGLQSCEWDSLPSEIEYIEHNVSGASTYYCEWDIQNGHEALNFGLIPL
jgi:hypothetical protein